MQQNTNPTQTWFEWRKAPVADFAVIGDPVAHSWSPKMHQAVYTSLGLPYKYVAIRVPKEEFDEAVAHLKQLGYRGLNVTVPLKEIAYQWIQEIDEPSRSYGAINTLDLWHHRGTNTDAPGFLDTLHEMKISLPGPVLIIGAGGSARALCLTLVNAGYKLFLYNRTQERAHKLLEDLQISATILSKIEVQNMQLVVNTTSVHLQNESLKIDWSRSLPNTVAYYLSYSSVPTAFLQSAAQENRPCIDGSALLVAQGARSFEWWLGQQAPRAVMKEAIYK